MNHTLRVEELHTPLWKYAVMLFTGLAVILFVIYWNLTNVFWAGMVRLASFASFTGAILSGLKAMEGRLDIEIIVSDHTLDLVYYKKENKIHEQAHELGDITSISRLKPQLLFSQQPTNTFVIRFKDSDQNFDLFHFGGRTLKFDNKETEKLITFFREHSIPFNDGINIPNT